MRPALVLALLTSVAALPAAAQTAAQSSDEGRRGSPANNGLGYHVQTSQRPVDHGPFTPEANRAYEGGGVILQGAPGQPAPRPEPTPPGQIPRNAVPQ